MAKPVPEGLRTVTVSLCVSPCDQAIAFYEKAFGAKTLMGKMLPQWACADVCCLHTTLLSVSRFVAVASLSLSLIYAKR